MTDVLADTTASTASLGFDATVPRQQVHKAAIEQVLLSDSARIDENEFVCASQLPRAHRFYSDRVDDTYDPLLVLEVARQSGVLIAHRYLGIPRDDQFIFSDLYFTVHDLAVMRVGPHPGRLVAHQRLGRLRHRHGRLTAAEIDTELSLDGRRAMTVGGTAGFLPAERYRAYRAMMKLEASAPPTAPATAPVAPADVGRRDADNVVLREPTEPFEVGRAVTAEVVVDERHATFFDHPLDHVPGVLLIEAFRQAAILSACRTHGLVPGRALVEDCRVDYGRFAELGIGVQVTAIAGEATEVGEGVGVPVELRLSQAGERISEAKVMVTAP